MYKPKSSTAKAIISFLIVCILFVFSGIGVLAIPKPAQAQWLTIKDLGKFIENILLAIWKFAIYPLLKKIIITAIAKGEWAITEEEIKKWAVQDLAFQAANSVFNQITGQTLCMKINANLKLALSKYAKQDYKPNCTFEQSELVSLLTMDPDKRADELRKKLYSSLVLKMEGSNSEFGLTLDAMAQISDKVNSKKTSTKNELDIGKGLLTTRDCSIDKARAKQLGYELEALDADGDGTLDVEWRPEMCKKKSVEGELSDTLKKSGGAAGDEFGQSLKSQVLLDLIAVAKMAISTAIETYVVDPLKKWIADALTDEDETEVIEPTYSRSGENRLIEYPTESFIPEGGSLHPDLEAGTPVEE